MQFHNLTANDVRGGMDPFRGIGLDSNPHPMVGWLARSFICWHIEAPCAVPIECLPRLCVSKHGNSWFGGAKQIIMRVMLL